MSKGRKLVGTSRLRTSQNRNTVLKNLKLSVHSSRVQKIHKEPKAVIGQPKTSKCHSQSNTILKNSLPQSRKSESMRFHKGDASLNLSNGARRITRSSFGSVPNSPLKKKIQKPVRNRNTRGKYIGKSAATVIESKKLTTLRQSVEKPATGNQLFVVTEKPNGVTRSSFGSVTGLCSITNRNSKSNPNKKHAQLSSKNSNKSKQISQKNKQVIIKDLKRLTHSSFVSENSFPSTRNRSSGKFIKSKLIVENKDSCAVTKVSKKVTRSSFGRETGSTSIQIHSEDKCIKSKPIVEKKDLDVITTFSKRVTRFSLGSVTNSSSKRNKNSVGKLSSSPAVKSSDKQVKSKQTVKEKELISTEDSKRMTRSSLASATSTSISRNKSLILKNVSPPFQQQGHVKKQAKTKNKAKDKNQNAAIKHTKKLTRSSLEDVSGSSPVVQETPKYKLVGSPLLQSALKTNRYKKAGGKVGAITKNSNHKKHSGTIDLASGLEPDNAEVHERPKGKESCKTRKKTLSATIKVTPVPPISGPRKKRSSSHSGSSSGRHSYKTKQTSLDSKVSNCLGVSKSIKSYIEKELKDIPIDCLTNVSLNFPQQAVAKNSYKNINSHLIRSKNAGEHKLNVMEKEERNSGKSKISKGGKRKTKVSPCIEGKRKSETKIPTSVEGKRKREISPSTPASIKDPISSMDCLTNNFSNKRPRRHTVDVALRTKGTKKVSTTQRKRQKKSSVRSQRVTPTPKSASASRTSSSSTFTPDISLLPVDSISTFMSNRPNSAPAGIIKQSLAKGLNSSIPKKGTLKRKRWLLKTLKEKNECYEDDIFENKKFGTPMRLPTEPDEDSDSSIATPKFGFLLTPALPKKTPRFKDCISPSDLLIARKCAEEYQFRRQNRNRKRTSNKIITLKTPASAQSNMSTSFGQVPEKKKLEFREAMDKVKTIQDGIEKLAKDESEEEDDYFSDVCT